MGCYSFMTHENLIIDLMRTFILGPFRTFWNTYAISTIGTALCRINCAGTPSAIGIGEWNMNQIRRHQHASGKNCSCVDECRIMSIPGDYKEDWTSVGRTYPAMLL